jgi:hypothetical protein
MRSADRDIRRAVDAELDIEVAVLAAQLVEQLPGLGIWLQGDAVREFVKAAQFNVLILISSKRAV